MIMEGNVFVDNNREDKAGSTFDVNANIEVKGNTLKYVSRGGLKLEKAMTHFGITLEGKVCMDIGASTGWFYGLYAPERRGQSLCCGRGIWSVCVETAAG